jgi:acid phosphatase type 7
MQEAIEDTLFNYKVDIVFSGHVHAYERSCQVYKYECTAGAPTYITIGDGGNAEGLASEWVEPQPSWSIFRQASYGFGALQVINSTHAQWAWHQNGDLIPAISDQVLFNRSPSSSSSNTHLRGSIFKQFTFKPIFSQTPRGELAKLFNDEAIRNSVRQHH